MIKVHPYRSLLHFLFVAALFSVLSCPAAADDAQWKPVTNKLLSKLHLDRRFHKCIAVADGDTITLKDLGTVRFIGVDTPEKNHPMLPAQFMAEEAGAFTRKLCLGKNVRLEYDGFDEDKRGNYGRILGYLYLEDGTFLQKQLLLNGYAGAYTKYPFDGKRKERFLAWEREARQKEQGLWKNDGMDEISWILDHRQLLIQIEKKASSYRLRMGDWVSKPFSHEEIGHHLIQLYGWVYALGPRDLRTQLIGSGYEKKAIPQNSPIRVAVLGMAHKKWGIIYRNFAKPRVQAADLGMQIRELCQWMENLDPELLSVTLSLNGYHPVSEKLIATLDPKKIAETFLETKPLPKRGRRVISWETAGDFIGKQAIVEGKIVRSFNSGKACFLNFHRNFTRYVSLVIFENSFRKFPSHPEKVYLNKTIQIRGKIREFEGKLEIVVERPGQIEIINFYQSGR
ncbi:MAG: thermonuclease family protein [Deltaproteobacteria bacterium]|nr:thermonuclease family protein [Deltaproteobacteria bacterium]